MLVHDLMQISKCTQLLAKQAGQTEEVSFLEQSVCAYIYHSKNASQADIAAALLLDKGNLAKLIATLLDKGLVTRTVQPTDRRAYSLSLTPRGEALLHETLAAYEALLEALLADVSAEERRCFAQTCAKLREKATILLKERWKQ